MPTYLVIGDGAAGMAAAQTLRAEAPDATITVLSDDPSSYYYRAALTNYLLGQLRDEQLWGVPAGFSRRHRIGRFFGRVLSIDPGRSSVALDSGPAIPYDALLIASGAAPLTLDVHGSDLSGVTTFRSLQDVRSIAEALPDLRHAVIVGGGPLGLEWVQALRHHNVEVTYLVREARFMPRVLDEVASEIVLQQLHAAGVNVVLQDEVAEIESRTVTGRGALDRHPAVGSVRSLQGRRIPCQMVGVAIGVRPNTDFLRGSGLAVGGGVLVDRYLRGSVTNVFAAGDVAQVRDPAAGLDLPPSGLWQPARAQGKVAAGNMAHPETPTPYEPGASYQATHLYGLDFAAVGLTLPAAGDGVETIEQRPGPTVYRKLLLQGGKLTGALFVGDRHGALLFKRIIDGHLDVSSVRDRLLDPQFDLAAWVRRGNQISGIFSGVRPVFRVQPEAPRPSAERVATAAAAGQTRPTPEAGAPAPAIPPDAGRLSPALRLGDTVYRVHPETPTTLGRATTCDVVLAQGHISRRHAEVAPLSDGFALRDLDSANGTWLGLTRLQPWLFYPLQEGDRVRLGDTFLTFVRASADIVGKGPPAAGSPVLIGPAGPAPLTGEMISLGRTPQNDIVVPSTAASRLHAQIHRAGDGDLFLYDMGSTNGTLVNGTRITDAHLLVDGDVIAIAGVSYTFTDRGERSQRPPVAELTVLAGPGPGTRFALGAGEVTIGRSAANTLVLEDPLVSRRQATIGSNAGVFTLRDENSTRGTRVNGALLTAPHRLVAGDVIEVGQTRLAFNFSSMPAIAPAGALPAAATIHDQPTLLLAAIPAQVRVAGLVVIAGAQQGERFPLQPGAVALIGRRSVTEPQECTIAIAEPHASRQHARLDVAADGATTLSDLGSRNGTAVNGQLLTAPRALVDGDRIAIGTTELQFTTAAVTCDGEAGS